MEQKLIEDLKQKLEETIKTQSELEETIKTQGYRISKLETNKIDLNNIVRLWSLS